jgi:hypothetical protein
LCCVFVWFVRIQRLQVSHGPEVLRQICSNHQIDENTNVLKMSSSASEMLRLECTQDSQKDRTRTAQTASLGFENGLW